MTTKSMRKEKNTITRFMKAPLRVLTRAKDLYIRSLTNCAGHVSYGSAVGGPIPQSSSNLPKSFSVNSTSSKDQDFMELMRAASTRSLGNKIEMEFLRRQSPMNGIGLNGVPRSQSVAVGRIDEDKPSDFGDDIKVKTTDMYPRSRSHAVSRKNGLI